MQAANHFFTHHHGEMAIPVQHRCKLRHFAFGFNLDRMIDDRYAMRQIVYMREQRGTQTEQQYGTELPRCIETEMIGPGMATQK